MRYVYLNEDQANVVHAWWHALDQGAASNNVASPEMPSSGPPFRFDRGHRARLRRGASLQDLEAESACFELRERLGTLKRGGLDQREAEWLFLVCGVVARVEHDTQDDRGLALALGASSRNDGSAPMSELRFRRLLKEDEPASFFRQLRRALHLASGKINVARLADDLLAWTAERSAQRSPVQSVRYRWARDYFLDRKDQRPLEKNSAATIPAENDATAPHEETIA